MKCLVIVLVAVAMAFGASSVLAQEYAPGETFSQIPPDRVLALRRARMLVPAEAYAPYTPSARYAFDDVLEQIAPERALASRLEAGAEHLVAFMPYTSHAHYAPGCVCTQVSPDRVLEERVACGICTM